MDHLVIDAILLDLNKTTDSKKLKEFIESEKKISIPDDADVVTDIAKKAILLDFMVVVKFLVQEYPNELDLMRNYVFMPSIWEVGEIQYTYTRNGNLLHYAAYKDDIELVKMLLDLKKYTKNEVNTSGQNVLHMYNGCVDQQRCSEILDLLMTSENISTFDLTSNTPLHYYAMRNQFYAARHLVANNEMAFLTNLRNKEDSERPIHTLCHWPSENNENNRLIKLLLNFEDTTIVEQDRESPMFLFISMAKTTNEIKFDLFMSKSMNLLYNKFGGFTILHMAIIQEKIDYVKLLCKVIKYGEIFDKYKKRPIEHCKTMEMFNIVNNKLGHLLKYKFDANSISQK